MALLRPFKLAGYAHLMNDVLCLDIPVSTQYAPMGERETQIRRCELAAFILDELLRRAYGLSTLPY